MTEKLLQYLWNYKIFTNYNFKDTEGNSIEILDFGKWNSDSGPDFLMAKIKINHMVLAGNIELHIKSSDWIFHQHSADPSYQNIILHVVYQNDTDIEEFILKKIPTLELKNHIDQKILSKYEKLQTETKFIACEKIFSAEIIPFHFFEETLIQKLEAKSADLEKRLKYYKNNYEAVLFHSLAYSFGLKVNAEIFRQIAESVDFSVIQKIQQNKTQLEALLFGIAGWLEVPKDEDSKKWQREYHFLKAKYTLPDVAVRPKFLRLRPPNFPTLRLSQFADLYFQNQNLFSKIISAQKMEDLYQIFDTVKASEYWDHHYNFGKISPVEQTKMLTRDFADIIILNTVLPFKYLYSRDYREETADEITSFYSAVPPEKNSVITSWKNLEVPVKNALHSQSLVYHFNHNCSVKNCLNCSIGFKILKES